MLVNVAEAQADNGAFQEHIQHLKKAWSETRTLFFQQAIILVGFDTETMAIIGNAFAWSYFESILQEAA